MSKNYRTKTRISGQCSWRTIEMMASPAFRVLSHSAHRILDRLEIELAHHGGNDDGRLPVTFDHFAEYGIDRHSIAPAMREVEALKFIEVTERGRAGNAEYRRPNLFRLTSRASVGHGWVATTFTGNDPPVAGRRITQPMSLA